MRYRAASFEHCEAFAHRIKLCGGFHQFRVREASGQPERAAHPCHEIPEGFEPGRAEALGEVGWDLLSLVYGGVGDGAEWAQLAASIDGSVVIPDRPGFGLGYPVTFTAGNVRRVAGEWLTGIADGLRVEKINVVGCSMGGLFATAFALDRPDRIEHLVLAGSPASLVERMETFLRLWTAPGIGALITRAARFSDLEQVRSRIYRNYVCHPEAVPHDVLELTLAALQLPGKSAANRALLQAVMSVKGVRPELRFRDAMTRLEIPTLFAWGDSDRLEPASTGMALAGEMPAATHSSRSRTRATSGTSTSQRR